jgi:hypothetical protein
MRQATSGIETPPLAPHRRFQPTPREATEPPSPRPRGLYRGEPANCRRDWRQFAPIWLHAALIWGVAVAYRQERGLSVILAVAAAALPVHYLLPYRWKRPFFAAVSALGLGLVFGWETAAAVLPVAAVLIALAVAPIRWGWKAGAMAAVASGLALARAGYFGPGLTLGLGRTLPSAMWPVLGTMFMFRMIIYLYELKHARKPESVVDTAAYFCLLPNFCFLHFPVVDYRTFLRGYFAADIHAIQRRGLRMMLLGLVQLLGYRFLNHRVRIGPDEVEGLATLARYLGANYLLYLHVAGQFHLACGVLHLFGHQLPETHHNFLLASSFTDYWRRINIYWKDFMVRVFFNPVVFRLKKRPQAVALAAATAVVFLTTWALHAYQSFWLSGRWNFSVPDALFWGVLGLLVMVNVQLDARRKKKPAAPEGAWATARAGAIRAAKTAGTLATISLLWSLWTSQGVGPWLEMLRRGLLGGA